MSPKCSSTAEGSSTARMKKKEKEDKVEEEEEEEEEEDEEDYGLLGPILRNEVLLNIRCMNCNSPPVSPVYACSHRSRHYLCTLCYGPMKGTKKSYECPMLTESGPAPMFKPSSHAEDMLCMAQVKVKCKNQGCEKFISTVYMAHHLKVCKHA